jgi:diguanylate cyclase (GGDEF)-like protein/PAS domain S-box-containing protein
MVADVQLISGVAQTVLAHAPDLMGIADDDGTLRFVNEAARSILGFEPAEMVGSKVFDFVHPDEVEDTRNWLASTAAHKRSSEPIQLRVRTASSAWRDLEIVATNLLADSGVHGVVFTCRDLSHRGESERRLRVMFEQSPVAQALIAPDHVGIVANATFARLFGISRRDLLETLPETLVHPDDRERAVVDRGLLETGDTPNLFAERRYLKADGEVFVGRSASSALYDADGRFEYLFVTLEDVSLQLRAAESLARSEARARALVDNSPDIIAVLHPDGDWEASDQGTRLLGYPKGFDPAGGVFSLVHPDDLERATSALADVLAGSRQSNEPIELRLRAADGLYRPYECVGQNLADDQHIGGVVITARDISERKTTEARLRAAEQRFHVAFERAPMIVAIVGLEGRIVDINRTGCELLRSSRDVLIGQPAELIIHPDDRAAAIDATTRQISGEAIAAEFRIVTPYGDELFVLSRAELVAGSDENDPPYVITLQADISDRKRLERELELRATHDHLTGLRNRASFDDHLERAIHARHTGQLAVVFIDLDNFKRVNDEYGHDAGDMVLRVTAERIATVSRSSDLAARWGGDEFVIACQNAGTRANVEVIAARLRAAISPPIRYGDLQLTCGASIGIALARPNDDISALMWRADNATYSAKHQGKNRTVISQ